GLIAAHGARLGHAEPSPLVGRAAREGKRGDREAGALNRGPGRLDHALELQEEGQPAGKGPGDSWHALGGRDRRDREERERDHAKARHRTSIPPRPRRSTGRAARGWRGARRRGIRVGRVWRGDRVVEGARLLSVCRGSTPTEGSNPSLSAQQVPVLPPGSRMRPAGGVGEPPPSQFGPAVPRNSVRPFEFIHPVGLIPYWHSWSW